MVLAVISVDHGASTRHDLATRPEALEVIELVAGNIVVYDNPIPALRSRHAFFPGMAAVPSGDLVAPYSVGEAFESDDHRVHVSRSRDKGRTWQHKGPMNIGARNGLGSMKPTLLDDGSVLAIGYAFYREDPHILVNATTGGLPAGADLLSVSRDDGKTWSLPEPMTLSRPELLEISGPAIQLRDVGDVLAIGTPLTRWDGTRPSGHVGVLLRSEDRGRMWDDRALYFNHPTITPLEARLCQMESGRLVAIVWAFDERAGRGLNNHIVISHDEGRTWSDPCDIGIAAQASNLLPLANDRLLSVHAQRESDPTGVVVRVVDLANDRWTTLAECNVWGRAAAMKVTGFGDMGTNLKFGQPALIDIGAGEFLVYHWAIENGQGRILAHLIRVRD